MTRELVFQVRTLCNTAGLDFYKEIKNTKLLETFQADNLEDQEALKESLQEIAVKCAKTIEVKQEDIASKLIELKDEAYAREVRKSESPFGFEVEKMDKLIIDHLLEVRERKDKLAGLIDFLDGKGFTTKYIASILSLPQEQSIAEAKKFYALSMAYRTLSPHNVDDIITSIKCIYKEIRRYNDNGCNVLITEDMNRDIMSVGFTEFLDYALTHVDEDPSITLRRIDRRIRTIVARLEYYNKGRSNTYDSHLEIEI